MRWGPLNEGGQIPTYCEASFSIGGYEKQIHYAVPQDFPSAVASPNFPIRFERHRVPIMHRVMEASLAREPTVLNPSFLPDLMSGFVVPPVLLGSLTVLLSWKAVSGVGRLTGRLTRVGGRLLMRMFR